MIPTAVPVLFPVECLHKQEESSSESEGEAQLTQVQLQPGGGSQRIPLTSNRDDLQEKKMLFYQHAIASGTVFSAHHKLGVWIILAKI